VTTLNEYDRWHLEHGVARWIALVDNADGTASYHLAYFDAIAVARGWVDDVLLAWHNEAMADRDDLWAIGGAHGWDAWDAAALAPSTKRSGGTAMRLTAPLLCESCAEDGFDNLATTRSTNPDWAGYDLCDDCAADYDERRPIYEVSTVGTRYPLAEIGGGPGYVCDCGRAYLAPVFAAGECPCGASVVDMRAAPVTINPAGQVRPAVAREVER